MLAVICGHQVWDNGRAAVMCRPLIRRSAVRAWLQLTASESHSHDSQCRERPLSTQRSPDTPGSCRHNDAAGGPLAALGSFCAPDRLPTARICTSGRGSLAHSEKYRCSISQGVEATVRHSGPWLHRSPSFFVSFDYFLVGVLCTSQVTCLCSGAFLRVRVLGNPHERNASLRAGGQTLHFRAFPQGLRLSQVLISRTSIRAPPALWECPHGHVRLWLWWQGQGERVSGGGRPNHTYPGGSTSLSLCVLRPCSCLLL